MTQKKLLGALVLFALAGLGAWFAWRWYTAPMPPDVSLDGLEPPVVAAIGTAIEEVRREPRSGAAWGKLGMTLDAHGFGEPVIPCYVHAQHFDPGNPRWPYLHAVRLQAQRPEQAIVRMREALALCVLPEHRAAVLFRLANVLIEQGHLDEAAEALGSLASLEPDSWRVHVGLALVAVERGDRSAARAHLTRVTDVPFFHKRANLLLATLAESDADMVRFYKQRAAQQPPERSWPDPFDEEMQRCKVDRMSRIAPFLELEAQGRMAEAIEFLRQYVSTKPDGEVAFILGFQLLKAGEHEEAAQAFKLAIHHDARNVKSHLFLGVALLAAAEKRLPGPGGKDQAMQWCREAVAAEDQALKLQHDLGNAHLTRGRALKLLGRSEEAVLAFRQVILCQPELADGHLALGETLCETAQPKEGLEHLENAVRLAPPGDARPREALRKWRAVAGHMP